MASTTHLRASGRRRVRHAPVILARALPAPRALALAPVRLAPGVRRTAAGAIRAGAATPARWAARKKPSRAAPETS